MPFSCFGLSAGLVRAITDQRYAKPTPIQSQAIPVILEGRDLMATAQTGTGKTAAFTLPLLHRLQLSSAGRAAKAPGRAPRALVLTPTRELAAQVNDSMRAYGRHTALRAGAIFGGVSIRPQFDALRRGVDILVATPGRLLDHARQRTVDLSNVEILVLDEADRMLDMGFLPDIQRILALLPKHKQNLLFSATISNEIRTLAGSLLSHPVIIDVAPRNAPAEEINQHVHPVDRNRKQDLLMHLINSGDWDQTLVFTRTKYGADRLAQHLTRRGVNAAALHGDKSQSARTRALADFKRGRVRVLVATDIAARGLDINQLPLVVNYELPMSAEDYVHRIGRTGRAGRVGAAISLVCHDEAPALRNIQRLLGRNLPALVVEGFAPTEPLSLKSAGAPPRPRSARRYQPGAAPRRRLPPHNPRRRTA